MGPEGFIVTDSRRKRIATVEDLRVHHRANSKGRDAYTRAQYCGCSPKAQFSPYIMKSAMFCRKDFAST